MIESVTVTNYLGEQVTMMLARPESSGFVITNIEGLGPVSASINTTKVATNDGSMFNSALLDERNITMTLIFLDDGTRTVEEIRHESYKYFPIKRSVHLSIKTDNRILETDGYVESNEPVIFSAQEYTSISIICPDPFFYSPRYNVTDFSNIYPNFEFPFGTVENLTDFEFDIAYDTTESTVVYEGDHEVGIEMGISFFDYAESVVLHNKTTNESMVIDVTRLSKKVPGFESDPRFKQGDFININTKRRNKSITLTRDGVEYNILNCLAKGTKWFTLSKGENVFYFTADLDGEPGKGTKNVRLYIKNKIIYDGV